MCGYGRHPRESGRSISRGCQALADSREVCGGVGWQAGDRKPLGALLKLQGSRVHLCVRAFWVVVVVGGDMGVLVAFCLHCCIKGSKLCCSAAKTVFFLCRQETQSSPSERAGVCTAVLAACCTKFEVAQGAPPQMAWQKQSWIAAPGGPLENRRAAWGALPWKTLSPR